MSFNELILPEDRIIAGVIFKHLGAIFGGYLRDIYANVTPTDIDAVIFVQFQDSFENDLLNLGYSITFDEDTLNYVAEKNGERTLEFYYNKDDQPGPNFLLGPESAPDFDINLLTYNGELLYNWMEPDAGVDVIINHIESRKAHNIEASRERIQKIRSKGYTIIR